MTDKPPPDEAFHLTGDRLGKFMILAELGRGSMGVVYEAFQEDLKRKVALKILPANITLDAKQVKRFHREAESVARLRHDNVIQIFEVGQVDTTHYFAMELVDGLPLEADKPRDREGVLALARIARDAARGLAHAHEKGVIHRDIKPGNLLVDRSGRVVVTDFGLARLTDSASLTSTDAIVGTPKYMSPEQILTHAQRPVDGRADVYSLGATVYHLAAGRPPFDAPTVQAFIKAILEERPPSPRRFNRQIPHDLATIVLRCLEKDPEDRYTSAAELADDLDRFLAGDRIRAKPRGVLALATDKIRRHKFAALVGVTALAVLLVLVAGGKAREEQQRAQFQDKLKSIAAAENVDVAVSDIEQIYAEQPDDADVRELRATIYRKRAMKTLAENPPVFDAAIKDFEQAGDKGSLWYLMALVEAGRLPEVVAGAEALPEASPERSLALARVALLEQRYADAIAALPDPAAGPEETVVLAALTRGLAHRGLAERRDALSFVKIALEKSAGSPAWVRDRVVIAHNEAGGDFRDVLATLERTFRAVTAFADNLGEEGRFAKRLIGSILTIAKQAAVPSTQLEGIAKDRIAKSTGEERAVANLLLAIAEIDLDRREVALKALDDAEEESAPALEPYVYWARALVLRMDGNLPQAVESAQQAIELAMALPDTFPDLEHLCEHAVRLAKEVPPDQKRRADEFLKEKLAGMPPGLAWVSALLSRPSSAPDPQR